MKMGSMEGHEGITDVLNLIGHAFDRGNLKLIYHPIA